MKLPATRLRKMRLYVNLIHRDVEEAGLKHYNTTKYSLYSKTMEKKQSSARDAAGPQTPRGKLLLEMYLTTTPISRLRAGVKKRKECRREVKKTA